MSGTRTSINSGICLNERFSKIKIIWKGIYWEVSLLLLIPFSQLHKRRTTFMIINNIIKDCSPPVVEMYLLSNKPFTLQQNYFPRSQVLSLPSSKKFKLLSLCYGIFFPRLLKIEIKLTKQKIYQKKVFNSAAFTTSQYCATITSIQFRNIFITQKENPCIH